MAERGTNNGATLGFEQTLWQAADKMRGHIGRTGRSVQCPPR